MPTSRTDSVISQVRGLIDAIRNGDDALVEEAVNKLSGRRRLYAPLGMVVGAFTMLFEGLRMLLTNWRLMLIQILPAMWIWAAMLNLKAHVFYGKSFHPLHGWILVLAIAVIVAITAASSFLNAVFAFAVAKKDKIEIRPAFSQARSHALVVLGSGAIIGLALGLASLYVIRWSHLWFTVSLSIVIGVMMFAYVTVPARLIGMRATYSKSDQLKATVVGGVIGAIICSPPYLLARIGILMLGSRALLVPGAILLLIGLALQIGATSSVKAIKMSAKLVAGGQTSTS
jgi:hypothetical protein